MGEGVEGGGGGRGRRRGDGGKGGGKGDFWTGILTGQTDRLTHGLGRMCVLCYHPKRSLEGVVYLNNCDRRFDSQEDLIQWLSIF